MLGITLRAVDIVFQSSRLVLDNLAMGSGEYLGIISFLKIGFYCETWLPIQELACANVGVGFGVGTWKPLWAYDYCLLNRTSKSCGPDGLSLAYYEVAAR